MKLVTPDSEPLTLSRAWIEDVGGSPTPMAVIDGRRCFIETKESLLDIGVASCVPLTHGGDDWPHAVQILADGASRRETIWDATTHPKVVAAAKRWAQLAADDEIQIGTSLV